MDASTVPPQPPQQQTAADGQAGTAQAQRATAQCPQNAVASNNGSSAVSTDAAAGNSACGKTVSPDASQDIVKTEAETPLPLFPDLLQEASATKAQAPHDVTIWTDIRSGFGLPNDNSKPRVQAELDWYSKHAAYLERVTARAEPYLYYIYQQLKKRHMPTELALLPVVESAFIPYAYSRSRAAGIWQFTPSTGLHFGLKQNWWYDGRRDIYASTNAALDYLQLLHDQFGSWLLALAAYNSGAGTVHAAIRYNKRRHRPTDFWHLNLPRETRHYVPKLLAVKAIVQDPQKFAVQLWPIPNKPYLAVVDLKSQIDMALAAKLAGIQLKELYLLNPGYNRWATDPDGPHRLLLPASRVTGFKQALAKVPSRERVTWIRHRVRSGDTLSQIALEYHTTISIIRRTNHLKGNTIRAGHYLIVPRSSRPYRVYAMAGGPRRITNPLPKGRGEKQIHTIRSGDTLWDLARRYRVSVHQLARWNGLSTHTPLHPGKKLIIWVKPTRYASARASLAAPRGNGQVRTVSYTVRRGDSLYSIAHRFGVHIPDIRRWNDLGHKNLLHPGQPLKLRVDVTQQQNES
ncbi:MAG: LysM peptidoglycan-binding domain-containing protein [Acidihalobacter sp.]